MAIDRIRIDLLFHDLKGPLAVIETGINALLNKTDRYGSLTKRQQGVLERALRNAKAAQSLVDDTLEVGRSHNGLIKAAPITLSHFVIDTLQEIFDQVPLPKTAAIAHRQSLEHLVEALSPAGITLSAQKEYWHSSITIDYKKCKQVLRNVLLNALKHRNSRVELTIEVKSGTLVLSVFDDGKGIPAAYHKKIFESYFQLDNEDHVTVRGHGIGLAGVMILLKDMHGSLELESDTNKGAKFIVQIPLQ